MTTDFLHGVEVLLVDSIARPIQTVRSSVIGIIGTAEDADAEIFPLNTPVLITSRREFASIGATGTLAPQLDLIYDQGKPVTIVVRVAEGEDVEETFDNIIGGTNSSNGNYEGVQAFRAAKNLVGFPPKILIAPGFTHQRSANGILSVDMTDGESGVNQGAGYVTAPAVTVTDATGSGAKLRAVLGTGGDAGKVVQIIVDDPGRNYTAPVVTFAAPPSGGTQSTAGAKNLGAVRNAVISELLGVATALSAVIVADGPNTTDAAAIQLADDFGSPRIYAHDPFYLREGVAVPASGAIAGVISRVDGEKGFWTSPSNHEVFGITGTARHIDFELGDSSSRANLLNELKIATTIREQGQRLWGNRTLSSDPVYAFLSVVRTADMVAESIKQGHLWAVDRCITATYLEQVVETVRGYLRSLQQRGAIIGGDAWVDPDDNPASDIQNGNVKIRYHFTPCYPAERVTFLASITNEYVVNLFV